MNNFRALNEFFFTKTICNLDNLYRLYIILKNYLAVTTETLVGQSVKLRSLTSVFKKAGTDFLPQRATFRSTIFHNL